MRISWIVSKGIHSSSSSLITILPLALTFYEKDLIAVLNLIKFAMLRNSCLEIQKTQSLDGSSVIRAIFLINEITIIPPRHAGWDKLSKMYTRIRRNLISSPRILLFGRRETVSRGRLGVGGFSICLLVEKKEEGKEEGGTRGRKEVSSSLGGGARKERRTRGAVSSLHIPQGKLLTVSEEMTS